jgi:uncharacterized protein (DUF2235 family)
MPKVIAFLADGTWNGVSVDKDQDGVPEATNVLKLYHNLAGDESIGSFALENESERIDMDADRNVLQIAKYLHGVGDSDNAIRKMLGGAFGAGVISRIVRGYTFISRNYEPGDKIIIVGFSRGAYTARALGGMIAKDGLLDYKALNIKSKEEAYQYGLYVWASYREKRVESLAQRAINLVWRKIIGLGTPVHTEQMIRDVPIYAIGVWDTVGAMGIPVYGEENSRMDLFRFADTDLSNKVARGFHALAIDEYRTDFSPTPWTPRAGIEQAWFVGAHADVGGGYEEPDLSDFGLQWMSDKLAANGDGLRFKDPLPVVPNGKFASDIHDSWNALPFKLKPRAIRAIPTNADLHQSVKMRRNSAAAVYQPEALDTWAGQYID